MANPVALITGASSGIGREFSRILARDGYDCVIVARDLPALNDLKKELETNGRVKVTPIAIDLADAASPLRILDEISRAGLEVNVLVNDAGFGAGGAYVDQPWETTRDMVAVNVTTLLHLTRLVLPGMVARHRGKVLNVASIAAALPGPMAATYYATKALVWSFSEALWEETRGTGVTVTCLLPGPTRTEFFTRAKLAVMPYSKLMAPREVAEIGYRAMLHGVRSVVPGTMNRLICAFVRFVPKGALLRSVRRMGQQRGSPSGRG